MHGNLVFEDDSNAIILSDQLVDAFIIIIKLHTHIHMSLLNFSLILESSDTNNIFIT